MPTSPAWKFAESFDPKRASRLQQAFEFQEIIELVRGTITGIHVHACPGRDPSLKHCVQPVFDIFVPDLVFDAFFNSCAGYRAQFLIDPILGLSANLSFISTLHDLLIAQSDMFRIQELEKISIRKSISATSAKVWIHEDDFPFQNLTRDLEITRWLSFANQGEQKAIWGVCAPEGNRLQVKGALLDPAGNEVVPQNKVLRHRDINQFGFS